MCSDGKRIEKMKSNFMADNNGFVFEVSTERTIPINYCFKISGHGHSLDRKFIAYFGTDRTSIRPYVPLMATNLR